MPHAKKTVLAFSGGLDTTYCAVYLREAGCDVHAVLVNTGGFSEEDVTRLEQHATRLGVRSFVCLDARETFYHDVIRFLLFGNILKNNTYPLSVSAERLVQAQCVARYARSIGAQAVAHGSTGAGNDQVRFDLAFRVLAPELEIITPIRDQRLSREAEIGFLKSHGVQMNFEKAAYSINKGLWGTSVGGRETPTSHQGLPESAFPTSLQTQQPIQLTVHFSKGEPTGINGRHFNTPVEVITHLNELGGRFAIGRDIHVGDTIIGIKGRVGFEAPAAVLLIRAHHALEKHVLTKWQLYWKDQLAMWYGNWLHEGQYLDPVMRNIEKFMHDTQQFVTGDVFLELHPYRFQVTGVTSPHDLMSAEFGSYGEQNNTWTGEDVKGFTRIFSNQTAMYYHVHETAGGVQ